MAAQLNIMPNKFWLAGGYSEVHLEKHNGALSENQYSRSHYIFANAFYNVTRNFTVALEYLHGGREDVSNHKSSANRLSIMAQYNF
jgi:predicted porin